MIPVRSARQCRQLDEALIQGLGVPGRVLMEIAGREAAELAGARWPGRSFGVLCGPGNNGGDGFVVARWLALKGARVSLWAPRASASDEARANRELCARMGLPERPLTEVTQEDVLIDALLGTGQRSAPQGSAAEGAAALKAHAQKGRPVMALDLPTGLCADTGQALGPDVGPATLTVTFGAWKPGLLAMPGAALAGEVAVVDLGFALAPAQPPAGWLLTAADAAALLPAEPPHAAKWDRGHVAVLANAGAAVLAAHGAFRAGAGLVTVLAPRARWPELRGLWPEVMVAEPAGLDPRRHDVLVMGPGLGADAARLVRELWSAWPGPALADADALHALAEEPAPPPSGQIRVITPHAAEAARLLGVRRERVEADRWAAAAALGAFGLPVLKGPHTLIGAAEPHVSPVADPRLATAGSGDVLAGLIGGLLARRLPPQAAADLGVWLHGAAAAHLPADATATDLLQGLRAARGALLGARG